MGGKMTPVIFLGIQDWWNVPICSKSEDWPDHAENYFTGHGADKEGRFSVGLLLTIYPVWYFQEWYSDVSKKALL